MFREGGWVVPLQCDSPRLQSWLTSLQWGCSILGVPCDTYVSPELGVCPSNWSPLAMMGVSALFLALLVLVLTIAGRAFLRWLSSHGSTMAAIATAAAAELRKANPNLYPPAPHSWYRLSGEQLRAPMLCVVCQGRFRPEQEKVHCCEVCGVVTHDGCVRKVPHDCRPAAEAGDRMLHQWKPAGVTMFESEEEIGQGSLRTCVYCQDQCEADLFAKEPVWSCAWCRATTHVRCYRDFHAHALQHASTAQRPPQAELPNGRAHSSADRGVKEGAETLKLPELVLDSSDGHLGSIGTGKRQCRKHRRNKSLTSLPGTSANGVHKTESISKGMGSSIVRGSTPSETLMRPPRRASISSFLNTLATAVSGGGDEEEDWQDIRPTAGPRQPGEVDLELLDTCTFGPHR